MNRLKRLVLHLEGNEEAQDMVEYALLAGFIAVTAGVLLPSLAEDISTIFSKMGSVVDDASS